MTSMSHENKKNKSDHHQELDTSHDEHDDISQGDDIEESVSADEVQHDAEHLVEEIASLKDKLLRTMADVENTKRRYQREVEDMSKYAIANFARDLLGASDNLRRALESVPEDQKEAHPLLKTLVEGVELTEKELLKAFDKHKIVKINPLGEKFDHNYHQAMFEVESDTHEPGTVMEVMQPGYKVHERLLRPAMVGVAKAKS